MKRYFIVFWASWDSLHGQHNIIMEDSSFPARKWIKEEIASQEGVDPVITNIIELTEQDYWDWVK